MSRLQELSKAMPAITASERAQAPWGAFPDQQDINRLVIYRRAVEAGYYSDGPADETWVVNPKGSLGSLVTA